MSQDTVVITETATTTTPLQNEGTITSAPATDNTSTQLVEQAKREAEQARMRANQLENELKKFRDAQADAERKQLQEKEEYKQLWEKSESERRALEDARKEADRQASLIAATDAILKEYPQEVVEIAKTAGLSLTDGDEVATKALKEKLDAIKQRVTPGVRVTTNNPSNPTTPTMSREELVRRAAPGAPSPMAEAGARNDKSVVLSYISQLPAIQRMKEISRNGM